MVQQYNDFPLGTGINFKEYWPKLRAKWWLIILCLSLSLFVAWFYLRFKALPMYNVRAQVLIKDDNSKNSGEGLNLIFGGGNNKENEVAILQTRLLMEHLVRDYRLNETWYIHGKLKDAELFEVPFVLTCFAPVDSIRGLTFMLEAIDKKRFSIRYGEQEKKLEVVFGQVFDLPGIGQLKIDNPYDRDASAGEFIVQVASLDGQVARLRGAISAAAANKETAIINLSMVTAVPKKGEYVLSKFIDKYIEQNIRDKSRIADSTIRFIDERILGVNEELNGIEGKIQTFMQTKGLTNMESQSQLMLQNDNAYNQQLLEMDAQIELLGALQQSVHQGQDGRLVVGNVLGDDANLNGLIANYNTLSLERERLLLSYKADNPFIQNTDRQLQEVKQNILDYMESKAKNLQLKRNTLSGTTSQLKSNIRQVPEQQRAYLDLSRQQQLKQELYLFLLQKREETAVSKTNNIAGIRVIDPPKADGGPFQPKPNSIWTAAFLLGLALPIGGIMAVDLFNTKVRNRKDIEKKTAVPVIAELGHNATNIELIPFETARSAIAEQFRALRTNIRYFMTDDQDKVILITSGMPGEGKSFTSLNLANVYAVQDKRVLLMEYDLRRPKLSKTYKSEDKKGISNFVIDKSLQLEDIITPVGTTGNLFFVACGPIPPNPAELILNPRTKELLDKAREQFDIIIVDAPPVGAVTDGVLLSEYCDMSLFMMRADYTPNDLVELPEELRREGKMKRLAIVLNDINLSKSGYYGSNYYGYAYGYYAEETQKRPWWKRKL